MKTITDRIDNITQIPPAYQANCAGKRYILSKGLVKPTRWPMLGDACARRSIIPVRMPW